MIIIEKFAITNEEWQQAKKILQNTYYPNRDKNGKINEMINVPTGKAIIEIVKEIRKQKAL